MEAAAVLDGLPKKGAVKHSVPAKILALFSDLTQQDAEKRVKTALLLIHQVTVSEKHQDPGSLGPVASYCLTRLVRGLASSRAGAREGFFTALVQLLRRVPSITTASLLSVADSQLPDVRGDPRQGTEHRLGRLLAAGAAVRAGRSDDTARLAAALVQRWSHRAYMPPMVATFLVELVLRLSEEDFSAEVWPELRPLLAAGWEGCIPERLWLLLVCRRQFPGVIDSQFLKQHWGSKKVLSPKNHVGIMEMLKVSAGCLPTIHPLAASLAGFAVSRPASELGPLCRAALEPLLAERAAAALLALAVVQLMVPHLNAPELVEAVLSPAVVGALVQLLPKRDQRTEQAARGLGSALVSRVLAPDSSPELQLDIVRRLTAPPGSVNLDHMTGTKILAQILNGLKADALEPFSEIALSAFDGTQADQNLTPRGRAVACDLLCRLVQHPSTPQWTPLKERLLQRLFTAGVVSDEGLSEELAATALRAFFRALDHPVRRLSDLTALLRALTGHQDRLLRDPQVVLRAPLSKGARAAWDSAAAALKRLKKGEGPDTDVFVILLGHLSQQLFGADCATAIDALQELHVCLERQQQRRTPSSASSEPAWSEVVVDLLLSLLSLNVHLLRSVVRSVFSLLAPSLTAGAVMHVFQPLDPQFTMNGEPGDEDGEEGSGEESGEDSASEDGASEGSEDEWEDASSDGEEEDGGSEEEQEGQDDQLEDMRTRVKAALGDQSDDDAASVDMDAVPEEHFARVDEALAAAFRAMRRDRRMKRGGKQTDQEQALMHFRIRVLDLADVYTRTCPRSEASLRLLPALVSLLSACASDGRQAPLQGRLRTCLTRLTAAGGRLTEGHGLSQEMVARLLKEVLTSGARLPAVSLELGGLLAAAVRLLVRTSAQLDGDQTPVIEALREALDAFFNDRECVYPLRLFSQLLSLPSWPRGWSLVSPLLAATFSAPVRLYRRTQALQLVTAAVKNGALVRAVEREEVEKVATRLEGGVKEMVSDITSSDDMRTKYLSSALGAALALRQCAARLSLALPPSELGPALTQLGHRVALGRPLRRLVTQLGGQPQRPNPADAGSSPKKTRKTAESPTPAAELRPKKRSVRPKSERHTEEDEERDGSVDSGVAEEASDAEPPPRRKKKRRSDAGRIAV